LEGFAVREDFFPEEDWEAGVGVIYQWTMLDVQHCDERYCDKTRRYRSLPLVLKKDEITTGPRFGGNC
jgi:hypothetical protein